MQKISKIFIFILSFICFLSLGQIILCNALPNKDREIEQTEKEFNKIEEENQSLKTEIAKNGSLIKVEEKSQNYGFQKPLIIYLNGKHPQIALEH